MDIKQLKIIQQNFLRELQDALSGKKSYLFILTRTFDTLKYLSP